MIFDVCCGSSPTRTSATWPGAGPPSWPTRPGCSAGSGRWASTRARTRPRRSRSRSPLASHADRRRRRAARPRPGDRARPRRSSSPSRGDWWTPGRRVRHRPRRRGRGRRPRRRRCPTRLALAGLPVPYDALNGTGPDGRALWQRRARPRPGRGVVRPARPAAPRAGRPVGPGRARLLARRSPPATATLDRHPARRRRPGLVPRRRHAARRARPPRRRRSGSLPGRLRYPSAPLPRWWQIEDAQVSIGGQAPDRAALRHTAAHRPDREPLRRLVHLHPARPRRAGHHARRGHRDRLLRRQLAAHRARRTGACSPPPGWTRARSCVWATARTPLAGPVLDEVVIGIDEDANLVWAVEQVVAGRDARRHPDPAPPPRPVQREPAAQPTFSYLPMTPIPRYWHPYVIEDGRRPAPVRAGAGRRPVRADARAAAAAGQRPARRPAAAGGRTRCTRSSRPRSRRTACACSAARCWPAPPPASRCCGRSGAASRCSPRPPSHCASTS